MATRARLYLMYVDRGDKSKKPQFPRVRDRLAQWRLLSPDEKPEAIETRLGFQVSKGSIAAPSFAVGVSRFAAIHHCELVILPSVKASGLARFAPGMAAQDISRDIMVPTLFTPEGPGALVDPDSGMIALTRAVVPLDHRMRSPEVFNRMANVLRSISPAIQIEILHIGKISLRRQEEMSKRFETPVVMRDGPLVETMIAVAKERRANVITLPSFGQPEFLQGLKGTITERLLAQSEMPVLAAPMR